MPKIYFRDTGIMHSLLGIKTPLELLNHPKVGASFEGMAIEEIIKFLQATPEECYFWAVHQQAELDLLIVKDGKRLGFEIKYSSTPKVTKSMLTAKAILNLDNLTIIIPGIDEYCLHEDIKVIGIEKFLS